MKLLTLVCRMDGTQELEEQEVPSSIARPEPSAEESGAAEQENDTAE